MTILFSVSPRIYKEWDREQRFRARSRICPSLLFIPTVSGRSTLAAVGRKSTRAAVAIAHCAKIQSALSDCLLQRRPHQFGDN